VTLIYFIQVPPAHQPKLFPPDVPLAQPPVTITLILEIFSGTVKLNVHGEENTCIPHIFPVILFSKS